MMVGGAGPKPIAETLKAGRLSTLSPVTNGDGTDFNAVSCPSPSWCVAVGSVTASSGAELPLAESWNSGTWNVLSAAVPHGTALDVLNGVSCTSQVNCVAVGAADDELMVQRWNGTSWEVQRTVSPRGTTQSALTGIDCFSSTYCVAVGSFANTRTGLPIRPVVASWYGQSLSAYAAPNQSGATGGILESVTCTAAKHCVAAGSSEGSAGAPSPLADEWDGREWSVTTGANLGGDSYFEGVACLSARSCLAVGNYHNLASLAAWWDGATWTVRPYPHPGTFSVLNAIACLSADRCAAVGYYMMGKGIDEPLTAWWNGTRWTVPA
jgi:hypothetical protein